jgi:transposase-like protein
MKQETTKQQLLQGNNLAEHGQLLRDHLRQAVRGALGELMAEEVEALCGARYRPEAGTLYRRGGNEEGIVYVAGRKEAIERPRVRRQRGDGREEEAGLCTYRQARSAKNIEQEIFGLMSEGVSTRGCRRLSGETISAATASGLWVKRSAEKLEELRGRDLGQERWFGLTMDGVFLSRELVVLVALGITRDGRKKVLDFAVGSSESYEVAKGLTARLQARGFRVEGRLLAILDGSAALRKAVVERWPDAVIQHCVVHKERNLHGYLRRGDHGECSRLMKRLREAEGAQAGKEALKELRDFAAARNQAALASLEEAGDDLIALHLLETPATLHTALLSTNLIENAIHNYRRQTGRVTRWRPEGDQVERWTAVALLWIEPGFRKIRGYAHLPKLLRALAPPSAPGCAGSVPNSPLRGAAPGGADVLHSTGAAASALTVTANL